MTKPRGYRTQCDTGSVNLFYSAVTPCPETAVLPKPARWRCPKCVAKYGELAPEPRPTPRMP